MRSPDKIDLKSAKTESFKSFRFLKYCSNEGAVQHLQLNLLMHSLNREPTPGFEVDLLYGTFSPSVGKFQQELELKHEPIKPSSGKSVDRFTVADGIDGSNYIMIQVKTTGKEQVVYDNIVSLREIPRNRFITQQL